MCQATGYQVVKVSELADSPLQPVPDILLIDAMGWLKASYQLASFAFVGGSFAPKGGHNALEPALYGIPTIMGPSIFNNPVICQALSDAGGLTILTSCDGLASTGLVWLNDAQEAKRTGFANQVVLEQNRGAIEQTLEVIQRVFPQSRKH
jgi:3-deoxy-D-manno-octulosonic-acid transferase